jgi:hypothetical protein
MLRALKPFPAPSNFHRTIFQRVQFQVDPASLSNHAFTAGTSNRVSCVDINPRRECVHTTGLFVAFNLQCTP